MIIEVGKTYRSRARGDYLVTKKDITTLRDNPLIFLARSKDTDHYMWLHATGRVWEDDDSPYDLIDVLPITCAVCGRSRSEHPYKINDKQTCHAFQARRSAAPVMGDPIRDPIPNNRNAEAEACIAELKRENARLMSVLNWIEEPHLEMSHNAFRCEAKFRAREAIDMCLSDRVSIDTEAEVPQSSSYADLVRLAEDLGAAGEIDSIAATVAKAVATEREAAETIAHEFANRAHEHYLNCVSSHSTLAMINESNERYAREIALAIRARKP